MSKWTKKKAAFAIAKSNISISDFKQRYDLAEKMGEFMHTTNVDANKITPDNQVEFAFSSSDSPDDKVGSIDLIDDRFLDVECHMITKMFDKSAYKKECKKQIETAQSALGPKKKLAKTEKERIQKDILSDVMKDAATTSKVGAVMYDCETGTLFMNGIPSRYGTALMSKLEVLHKMAGCQNKFVANWEYFSKVNDRSVMFKAVFDITVESYPLVRAYAGDISVDIEDDSSSGELKKAKFSGDAPSLCDHAREIILDGNITSCVVSIGDTYIVKLSNDDPKVSGMARTDGKKLEHYDYFKFVDTCRNVTE